MTTAKVALTIPSDVLEQAKSLVRAGRAKSLSSFVSEAVADKVGRDELSEILDTLDRQYGKPTKGERAWAKRVLARSS